MDLTMKYILCTTKYGVSGSSLSQLSVTHKALNSFVEDTGLFNTMGEKILSQTSDDNEEELIGQKTSLLDAWGTPGKST